MPISNHLSNGFVLELIVIVVERLWLGSMPSVGVASGFFNGVGVHGAHDPESKPIYRIPNPLLCVHIRPILRCLVERSRSSGSLELTTRLSYTKQARL